MADKPQTTPTLHTAIELHGDLFGREGKKTPTGRLEVKLIKKYLDEAFEAGRAHER